jgi:hypothetical protein
MNIMSIKITHYDSVILLYLIIYNIVHVLVLSFYPMLLTLFTCTLLTDVAYFDKCVLKHTIVIPLLSYVCIRTVSKSMVCIPEHDIWKVNKLN